jgi:hypothetical protein
MSLIGGPCCKKKIVERHIFQFENGSLASVQLALMQVTE